MSHLRSSDGAVTVLVCRLGNDSQIAAEALRNAMKDSVENEERAEIVDLIGGLRSWSLDVDPQFPIY